MKPGEHTNIYGRTAVDERFLPDYLAAGFAMLDDFLTLYPAIPPTDPRDTEEHT